MKDKKTTISGIIAAALMFATQNPDLAHAFGPAIIKALTLAQSVAVLFVGYFAKDSKDSGGGTGTGG